MQLPTMIVAGAQKCGTTTLADALASHPQIFMAKTKELHFFDLERQWKKGLEWYAGNFHPGPEHVHVGEATPLYMYDPVGRARMIETLPGIKIMVVLRDPVRRAFSHYWHERRRGRETLETFEEAIDAEPERLVSGDRRHIRWHAYVDRGRYIEQLRVLERAYGRENLHVMMLDDLASDPVTTMAGPLEFLGLDPAGAAQVQVRHKNRYRPVDGSRRQDPGQYPTIEPATRARLAELFRDPNEQLADWWGRDLSAWGAP